MEKATKNVFFGLILLFTVSSHLKTMMLPCEIDAIVKEIQLLDDQLTEASQIKYKLEKTNEKRYGLTVFRQTKESKKQRKKILENLKKIDPSQNLLKKVKEEHMLRQKYHNYFDYSVLTQKKDDRSIAKVNMIIYSILAKLPNFAKELKTQSEEIITKNDILERTTGPGGCFEWLQKEKIGKEKSKVKIKVLNKTLFFLKYL